jgi:hypothetical protein
MVASGDDNDAHNTDLAISFTIFAFQYAVSLPTFSARVRMRIIRHETCRESAQSCRHLSKFLLRPNSP